VDRDGALAASFEGLVFPEGLPQVQGALLEVLDQP
jgi:hypothetical protein